LVHNPAASASAKRVAAPAIARDHGVAGPIRTTLAVDRAAAQSVLFVGLITWALPWSRGVRRQSGVRESGRRPPASRSPQYTPLFFRTIFRFISRIFRDDGLHDPVTQIVSHMDFEIYWPFGPAFSAPETLAGPIHNDGGNLFGRFVDNDLPSFEGQRDVENLEPSEAATFPLLLLHPNFAGQVQAAYCRCNLSSFIARDIKRVLGADDD
jgi:hypothetical protein